MLSGKKSESYSISTTNSLKKEFDMSFHEISDFLIDLKKSNSPIDSSHLTKIIEILTTTIKGFSSEDPELIVSFWKNIQEQYNLLTQCINSITDQKITHALMIYQLKLLINILEKIYPPKKAHKELTISFEKRLEFYIKEIENHVTKLPMHRMEKIAIKLYIDALIHYSQSKISDKTEFIYHTEEAKQYLNRAKNFCDKWKEETIHFKSHVEELENKINNNHQQNASLDNQIQLNEEPSKDPADVILDQAEAYCYAYHYEKAEECYNKVIEMGHLSLAIYPLFLCLCDQGKFKEAEKILSFALKQKNIHPKLLGALADELEYLSYLLSSASCKTDISSNTNALKGTKPVVFFDFDNTIMRSQEKLGTFYQTYPFSQAPEFIKTFDNPETQQLLSEFYTGSQKKWKGIFESLKNMGFILGICTARFKEHANEEKCPLFRKFKTDFGHFFDEDFIIFTGGQHKFNFILNKCQNTLPNQIIHVDDTREEIDLIRINQMNAIIVDHLVLNPNTFTEFKKHVIETANKIINNNLAMKNKKPNPNQWFSPSKHKRNESEDSKTYSKRLRCNNNNYQ